MKNLVLLFCMGVLACGCAAVDYSTVSPEAQDFHPQSIAVLPVMVGEHLSAVDVVDQTVSNALVQTGWFAQVVDPGSVRGQLAASPELSTEMTDYIQKLTTLGMSDKDLAGKMAETLKVDAFLLTSVTSWGYGRLEGNKIGKVGLALQLISGKDGGVVWKASHEKIEDYWVVKPDLAELTKDVMELLLKKMPH